MLAIFVAVIAAAAVAPSNAFPHRHPFENDVGVVETALAVDEEFMTMKPLLRLSDKLENAKFSTGETIVLRCEATTIPSAVIHWEKNGKVVQGDVKLNIYEKMLNIGKQIVDMGIVASFLTIPCASKQDSGMYKCIAFNGHDTVESVAEIEIEGDVETKCPSADKSAPHITMLSDSRFEMSGNVATLMCRSDKDAVFTWKFEGEDINMADKRYQLKPNGDLVIKKISWDDMGEYTCQASNEFGSSVGETFLYPTKKAE